jgi:rfaE bifunctional protein kinase chain/domain
MNHLSYFLSIERLTALLNHFASLKIGVIGDIGLDAYWYVDMTRAHLSRETPHFPRPVVRESYGCGAGANVAHNLKTLGVGTVRLFSVVGQDNWAIQLKAELARQEIDSEDVLESHNRRTTAYIKPILMGYNSQQEDARLDFENMVPLTPEDENILLARLEQVFPDLDALIIADQLEINGIVTSRVRERLNELAGSTPEKIFLVDSRTRIQLYRWMVIKPNQIEAAGLYSGDSHALTREELQEIGITSSQSLDRPVFITLGEEGVLVCGAAHSEHIPVARVCPPLDMVGAGDTFMAALAAGLAAGAAPCEAGALANLASAVTVEKLNQTGTASPIEILERYALCLE